MTELWQSYGSWIIYGILFIVMILLHGRMHAGHGHHVADDSAHGAHANSRGGNAYGDDDRPAARGRTGWR